MSKEESVIALSKDVQYLQEKLDEISTLLRELNSGLPKIRTDISIMFDKIKRSEERLEFLEGQTMLKNQYEKLVLEVAEWVKDRKAVEKFLGIIIGFLGFTNLLFLIKLVLG